MVNLAAVPVERPPKLSPKDADELVEKGTLFSGIEINLTIVIFFFGVIALVVFFMMSKTGRVTPMVMRLYVIVILVFGTLLVVSSSYATAQIAPVVGLFGTIAGYLLGKSDRQNDA